MNEMKEEKRSLVFISYSTHNKDIAFEACDYLEAAGIACWIAPRNVVAGANYAGQIVSAIRNCDAFVLPSSPQFSKVSLICVFNSSLSVKMTKVGEPSTFLRIFCARNTIE